MPSSTSDKTLAAYKAAAVRGLYPFGAALGVAALSAIWFIVENDDFALAIVVLFVALLAATVIYGFSAIRRL